MFLLVSIRRLIADFDVVGSLSSLEKDSAFC